MIFINSTIQTAFFDLLCKRRGKRREYGAITHIPIGKRAQFDRCLNMIASHHPHIWSYGTGNLLVAPPLPTPETITNASTRAIEWRLEALKEHDSDGIVDEGFGYFIRYTLECRERISIFRKEFDRQSGFTLIMFEYIDSIAPQLYDLISIIKIVNQRGKIRHGNLFNKHGSLTDNQTNSEILVDCNHRPNIKVLREFMVDMINAEFVTDTISTLVVPSALLYADNEAECVTCLEKKEVLMWPCHTSHVTCQECTIELCSRRVSCPICLGSLVYKYGKWYKPNSE